MRISNGVKFGFPKPFLTFVDTKCYLQPKLPDNWVNRLLKKAPSNLTEEHADSFTKKSVNISEIFNTLKTWCGITITKTGDTYGIPVDRPLFGMKYEELSEYFNNVKKIYEEERLPKLAALPQKAFDAIARDFKTLNQIEDGGYSYSFTTSDPCNFIISDKSIKIVGKINKNYFLNRHGENVQKFSTLADMLAPFLCEYHAGGHVHYKPVYNENLVDTRKGLLTKCIIASEKEELPLEFNNYEIKIIDTALQLSGFGISGKNLINKLNNFRERFPDLKERLEIVSKYLKQSDRTKKSVRKFEEN